MQSALTFSRSPRVTYGMVLWRWEYNLDFTAVFMNVYSPQQEVFIAKEYYKSKYSVGRV
jgi:hypothetical protein